MEMTMVKSVKLCRFCKSFEETYYPEENYSETCCDKSGEINFMGSREACDCFNPTMLAKLLDKYSKEDK